MKLQRITQQQPETLVEFYQKLKPTQPVWRRSALQGMIELIMALESLEGEAVVWAYTSDLALVLTRSDHIGPGLKIDPLGKIGFTLSYPLMREKAPFQGALIEQSTYELSEAIELILQAFDQIV
jgi:hypothetical protein